MKKEWFSSHELIVIDGLPSTIQGINQKARRENWTSRKRVGVQGRAVEYHINNLPETAKNQLKAREHSANYGETRFDSFNIWLTAYNQLTAKERVMIASWIMRHGISGLLASAIEDKMDEKHQELE